MNVAELAESMRDYARDIKLNLSTVLTVEGSPGLSGEQIWGIALSCSYFTKNKLLIESISQDASQKLSVDYVGAAKAASAIMAMNNIYYRFLHLSEDKSFSKMPARLRMNIIGKHGIEKNDFELMCLAVSAMAGCGSCINSHLHEASKAGTSLEGQQSAIRIAAVINSAAQVLAIDDDTP